MLSSPLNARTRWKMLWRKHVVPGRVVNLCFLIVLISSTLLTWREVVVLQDAYVASHRSVLEKAAVAVDKQMQTGVNLLLFYRNGMQAAMHTPLSSDLLVNVQNEFDRVRRSAQWQINVEKRRTLALRGVSDEAIAQNPLLNRDVPGLQNEMTAALELGYVMRLSAGFPLAPAQTWYASRAGFYLTSGRFISVPGIARQYSALINAPWFIGQSQRENQARGIRWYSAPLNAADKNSGTVIASLPMDYAHYWHGVLAVEFTRDSIRQQLEEALKEEDTGNYQLYDDQFTLLISSTRDKVPVSTFDDSERERLTQAMANNTEGSLRIGTRLISWMNLKHYDGALLRIHTLREGLQDDFGTISIVFGLLWLLFTSMLLISWFVIRRMVSNMYQLQHSLQWQAWHDALTRLNNRGALFEKAKRLCDLCSQQQLPLSVIQIDLDHFKRVNDRYGHQAGDLVLTQAARLIARSLGEDDVAGRVGGEEFCVLLPGKTLAEAVEVAQDIRMRIAGKEILVNHSQTIRISASLGVSSAPEEADYSFDALQSIADRRLYLAKRAGRNQVWSVDEDEPSPSK